LGASWFGILVRAGTPDDIRQRLNQEIVAALRKPQNAEKMKELGIDPQPSTPEEFAKFMKRESKQFAEAIEFSGTKIE
jgi:tripartite-type tricarboxylate transporter receptor subunit TctC